MKLYFVRHGRTIWNLEGRFQGAGGDSLNNVFYFYIVKSFFIGSMGVLSLCGVYFTQIIEF